MSDPDILRKAIGEERILLTMDLDFSDLLAASGGEFPSVVIFRLEDERSANVSTKLSDVIERFGPQLEEGVIVSVRESLVRIRKLPLTSG